MRYFQYLAGENRGKVVRLKEIDDISKPGMTIYVFDDGFKCSDELIADINDKEAVNNHMILAAVQDTHNIWKFRESKVEEKSYVGHYNNQDFEIPDPYFINKDGKREHEPHVTVTPVPPKVSKEELEPFESFFLSVKRAKEEELQEKKKTSGVAKDEALEKTVQDTSNIISSDDMTINIEDYKVASAYKIEYDPKDQRFKLDFKDPSWFSNKVVEVVEHIDGEDKSVEYNVYDLLTIGRKAVDEAYAEQEAEDCPSLGPGVMLKNCKKSPADVSMTLTLNLPSIDAYKLIKENYPEEWAQEFIEGIIMKLSTAEIKKSLSAALTEMYESAVQS